MLWLDLYNRLQEEISLDEIESSCTGERPSRDGVPAPMSAGADEDVFSARDHQAGRYLGVLDAPVRSP